MTTPPRLIPDRWYKRGDGKVRQCLALDYVDTTMVDGNIIDTPQRLRIQWLIPTVGGRSQRFVFTSAEYRVWARKGDVEVMDEGWSPCGS